MSAYTFEPGVAYWFNACVPGGGRFLAVAADHEGGEVAFVRPKALLSGTPRNIDGRETVFVRGEDGQMFFASAAARESVTAAAKILTEIESAKN